MSFPKKQVIATIREFVECESPSDDPVSVNHFVDVLAETVKDIARVKTYPGGKGHGKHVRCEFLLPWSKKSGQIMALGHSDTVWPLGTLRTMPFRQAEASRASIRRTSRRTRKPGSEPGNRPTLSELSKPE